VAITVLAVGEKCTDEAACDRLFTIVKGTVVIVFSVFQLANVFDGLFHDNLYELYAATAVTVMNTVLHVVRFAEKFENSWKFVWQLVSSSAG